MEFSCDKEDKVLEFLNNYPALKLQYLFLNCFVISSNYILSQINEAQEKMKSLKKIEIYYTPKYLYENKIDNQIFNIINNQENKRYYYLKDHIFYYQYLLRCLKAKNEKEDTINTVNVNEISYRTLLNRLYLLCENSNSNDNYGINEVFGVPCIYSIIEPNIIEQIINMKKFSFELLKMNKDKVMELFGINEDIDNQSFLYNKLLISISEGNSSISGANSINYDKNDDLNKINKGIIEIEKYLINLASELFLFHYITKQFDKDKLVQLPRMIFFCCLYDEQCRNIYEIQTEKSKRKEGKKKDHKKGEEEEKGKEQGGEKGANLKQRIKLGKFIYKKKRIEGKFQIKVTESIQKKRIGIYRVTTAEKEEKKVEEKKIKGEEQKKRKRKGVEYNEQKEENKKKLNKERENKKKEERDKQLKGKENQRERKKTVEQKGKEKVIESEKLDKNILKCILIQFCGTLELDGAFKYNGKSIEIKGDSLVIILSEYLNKENKIKELAEIYEAKNFIQKIKKYNIDSSKFKNYNTINLNDIKNDFNNSFRKLQEIANKQIISEKRIFIDKSDLVLIENKREYPHHMANEIRNFIEHSFYFINLYEKLKILEKNAKIHLLFVYDHYRNYNYEGEVVVELFKIIKDNSKKLKIFSNKIKFYLVHSLPNLNISIFNKLEIKINELNSKNENQKAVNDMLTNKVKELTNQNKNQKNINGMLTNKVKELTNQNQNQKNINGMLINEIKELKKVIDEMKSGNVENHRSENKKNK